MEELLKGFPVILVRDVEWGQMDAFSHVNNTVYFRFFESARLEYFGRVGFAEHMESHGVGPILASTSCRFKVPLTFPDTVSIGARVDTETLGEDRFTMIYRVVSHQHGAVAADGDGLIVSYDYNNACKASVPAHIRQNILIL
ncbi:MAG TPA: acyl-CoA thioesterase [Myxococcales bacterium]|nr:acyl-CoA thioesterase [Myxococcales bacterium]